jgi:mono/diheme cytochrome c family protein
LTSLEGALSNAGTLSTAGGAKVPESFFERLPGPVGSFFACLAIAAAGGPALAQPAAADPAGAQVYETVCAACHQPNGQGVPDAFPPLAGHVADLLAKGAPRDYLAKVVLFGLAGPISVAGRTFDGAMPPWDQLSDAELAGALNYAATAWGNDKALPRGFKPFTADEIASVRARPSSPEETRAVRLAAIAGGGATPAPQASAAAGPAFTEAQAQRGHAAYQKNCQDCHGANLDDGEFGGAPLKGSYFRQHWGSGSLSALFAYTKTKMPPDRPGRLSDQTYADIVAFFLSSNGYKAGDKELPSSAQEQQQITLKR